MMLHLALAAMSAVALQTATPSAPVDARQEAPVAQEEAQAAASSEQEPEMVCERRRQVGSNITRRVCYNPAEVAGARDAARDLLDHANRHGTPPNF